jgi:hypothetical protein
LDCLDPRHDTACDRRGCNPEPSGYASVSATGRRHRVRNSSDRFERAVVGDKRASPHLTEHSETVKAARCSKVSTSYYWRGKRTPHVSTWEPLGALVGVDAVEFVTQDVDTATVEPR